MSRILVVDDERSSVEGLRLLLRADGYEVVAMQSPAAALKLLKTERFDAVITDLEMPDVHGSEIVAAARSADGAMPVLVVSAYTASPAGAVAMRAGARRLLQKPLDYEELAAELAAALTQRSSTPKEKA